MGRISQRRGTLRITGDTDLDHLVAVCLPGVSSVKFSFFRPSWGPVHAPGTPRGGISTCYLDLLSKEFIWQLSYLFTLWVVVQQCYSWYQIVRLWSVVVLPSCLPYPCDMPPFFIFRGLPYFVVLQAAAGSSHFPALKPAISPEALVPFIGEWC